MSVSKYTLHPWHGVSLGEKAPQIVTSVIEIPEGSRTKYEVDKASGLIKMDRVLFSAYHYPANYGFMPQTLGEDGDPLDVLVLSHDSLQPLTLVDAKIIGVMHMIDQGEGDDKLIAVANDDCTVNGYNEISELPSHILETIQNFFESYKTLEKKEVEVSGYASKEVAISIIEKAIVAYKEKYA